jgi:hypothetical protein
MENLKIDRLPYDNVAAVKFRNAIISGGIGIS